MDPTTLLEKLSDASPQDPLATPLGALAALAVDGILEREVGELWTQAKATHGTHSLLLAWLRAPTAPAALEQLVEEVVTKISGDTRKLRDALDADVREALREVIGRPFSFDRKLVLALIDREPVRRLVRQLLFDVVVDFGKRLSGPVAGVAKGLGVFARMAGESVRSRAGGLGSLVGAMGSEVERQLDKRAGEFVDAALSGVLGELADALSNPNRAHEAAELRQALFDGTLELTFVQLAREVMNADLPGAAQVLRDGLQHWASSSTAPQQLESISSALVEPHRHETLRALLTRWGIADVVRALAVEQLEHGMRQVVETQAFAGWLRALWAKSEVGPPVTP